MTRNRQFIACSNCGKAFHGMTPCEETTNATTRLAMMRAVRALQATNLKRITASGVGMTVEQMAEILEDESGYRELYEALDGLFADVTAGGLVGLTVRNAARALAKARGESSGMPTPDACEPASKPERPHEGLPGVELAGTDNRSSQDSKKEGEGE